MKKLRLEELSVESFRTTHAGGSDQGSVRANQASVYDTCTTAAGPSCNNTDPCYGHTCEASCPPSCANTACVPACGGGGNISLAQSCYANCGNDEIE